ncbi:uncharacterized protein (TIGR01777 family) [Trueperella bonasi]|uniref:Uncharacterized protein (TIGR01777 family) n=1 Tax=Trueperella bonasi TaxID=312286 RepID=A0ABT9NI34_9ACTO|nr:TIGR01777 family oxidoreductase [Trueperella bonasi]MDP9807064.1 uncharacterized protein (TIGR01777 family) [Trueperella bonasi]
MKPILLLAGASGFIGTRLIEASVSAGYDVRRLVRSDDAEPVAWVENFLWDPARGQIDEAALDGAHAVICLNGAGLFSKPWTDSYKQILWDSRIDSVRTITDALIARDDRPHVFISGSAIGYYGPDNGDTVLTEDSPNGGGFLGELCEAWEGEANRAADAGIRTVTARTGLVMGASGGMLGILQHLYRIGFGTQLGDGTNWMATIARDDYVRALLYILLTDSIEGPVNMTSPDPVPNKIWHRALAEHVNRPAFLRAPEFAMRLALQDFADEAVLASQRVMPQKLLEHGYTFIAPTVPAIFNHEVPMA